MTITVKQVGGRIAVFIPRLMARDLNWVHGTNLEVIPEGETVIMRRKGTRPRRSMAKIVAEMKAGKRHRPADHTTILNDPPVGREIW